MEESQSLLNFYSNLEMERIIKMVSIYIYECSNQSTPINRF